MRVLLVNDLAPGPGSGAEVYVARLADGLRAAGHDVDVFAGEVTHTGWRRPLGVWDPRARRAVLDRARRFDADVVHFHNVLNELSPAVLATPADMASVLTVHDSRIAGIRGERGEVGPGTVLLRRAKDRLARETARRHIGVVVAVSRELHQRLEQVGFPRVRTVPLFVPAPSGPMPLGDDVVFAGQLAPDKSVHTLVEAFATIADRHPTSHLVVAGDGTERARLEALAARLAPGRVEFRGVLTSDAVEAVMAGARVVCDPAITVDGSRTAILEARRLGRPVVASDGPGQRELVADGAYGANVPGGDVAALAVALDRLLGDRELAATLGDAGRQALRGCTVEDAVDAMRVIYEEARARV